MDRRSQVSQMKQLAALETNAYTYLSILVVQAQDLGTTVTVFVLYLPFLGRLNVIGPRQYKKLMLSCFVSYFVILVSCFP